ncbi:hypothetical protein [Comamonas sp. CMM02]|uniref:hypothetical protein n=1 Tax=Comamonas sp. CMM02 TaxID=2769307 RepID=UPI001786BF2F|nr:hypothetical protein [Comamonas sp. CMM02]MBD9402359.1 hypothetical protein [Comamonas sp. CMM02]
MKYCSDKGGQELPDLRHTIPTRDRFVLVMVHGEPYAIVDIGLRMLFPRGLFQVQGFPDSYELETSTADSPWSRQPRCECVATAWPATATGTGRQLGS